MYMSSYTHNDDDDDDDYSRLYARIPHEFLPLKQIKTEIGNVSTISTMEPKIARISIKPPRCPSAEYEIDYHPMVSPYTYI